MKVLIVDDSKTILRIVAQLVTSTYPEAEVLTALDGAKALAQFDDSIDLILTDWNMPNMNGLELVKAIRQRSKVTIWMITTEGARAEVITALREGVNNYIVKPVNREIFIGKLRDFMNGKDLT